MSLLEKAKGIVIRKNSDFDVDISKDELELAIALVNGEVTGRQVREALAEVRADIQITQIDNWMKKMLVQGIKRKMIKLEIV